LSNNFDFSRSIANNIPPVPISGRAVVPRVKYDFTTAFLDPSSLPIEGLNLALKTALEDEGQDLAYYPHPQGHPKMREFITDKLKLERSMEIDPDQVILTTGSGQAVARVIELLTNPNDTVITEEFSYQGTLNILRRYGAKLVGAPMDREGIIPEALDKILHRLHKTATKAKYIYTIPTFQNPTGADMSLERRKSFLQIARNHNIPIFEDDCYADLRFTGENTPSLYALDDTNSVVYCGSFSKILAPGMRLGFMVVPKGLVENIKAIHLGATPSQFAILATLYFLKDHLSEHVQKLTTIFHSRKDTAFGAVGEAFGNIVKCDNPDGGLYLWLEFPPNCDLASILPKAREYGMSWGTGAGFSPGQDRKNYMRLCYGHLEPSIIRDGIHQIADFLRQEQII